MARKKTKSTLEDCGFALDMLLSGHDTVIGPDFVATRKTPFGSGIIPVREEDFQNYDQEFVDKLVKTSAKIKILIPNNLDELCNKYTEKRAIFGDYSNYVFETVNEYPVDAGIELGIYDRSISKVLIRNDVETNIFIDYCSLYRPFDDKKSVVKWNARYKKLKKSEKEISKKYENARFSLLRLDKNLDHGCIKVTNLFSKKECILVDKALNRSKKEGCIYVCSTMDMGEYIMTCGAGFPLDPKSEGGKTVLTKFKKYYDKIADNYDNDEFNLDAAECAREVYSFAFRSALMQHHTIN